MADKGGKTNGDVVTNIDAAHDALDKDAQQAAIPNVPASPSPDGLRRTWVKAQQLLKDVEKRSEELKDRRTAFEKDRREIDSIKKDVDRERKEIERRLSDAVEKERKLQERELNAEHGFRKENEKALRDLEKRAAELTDAVGGLESEVSAKRTALNTELAQLRSQQIAALEDEIGQMREARAADLEREQAAIAEEHEELVQIGAESRRQRRELEAESAVLADERAAMLQEVEARSAATLERLEAAKSSLEQRLEQARADRTRVEGELIAAQEAVRVLDGRPLDVIAKELKALRAERDQLAQELAERPEGDQVADIAELRRANQALVDELKVVRRERNEFSIAKERERGHLAQVEVLSDKARALESTIAAYKTTLEERKQDFDELVATEATRSPFERLSAMDIDVDLQEPPSQTESPTSLQSFVEEVRQRIADEPLRSGEPLFFTLRDLRIFVAGLAMSRLHLLQGISGTGKTSLPLAFAHAVGGGSDVVEVQAGWRDRQDLLGHYNTFERRYDETPFVQALYRAESIAFADSLFLVVLDEMNLSHPEQYFADVLSAQERGNPRLTLTNTSLEPAPARLEDGRVLRIPDNVWFVGTANHDETTMGFADKTYDRAHMQELPVRREEFTRRKAKPHGSLSLRALSSMFDHAGASRSNEVEAAQLYLEELRDTLTDRFNVGWGNRLDKQLRRFVPVVVEAGGSVGEAIDHLLSTKILRKVRDRHDISLDDIEALSEQIEAAWGVLDDKKSGPVASREILNREKRRLSGGLG